MDKGVKSAVLVEGQVIRWLSSFSRSGLSQILKLGKSGDWPGGRGEAVGASGPLPAGLGVLREEATPELTEELEFTREGGREKRVFRGKTSRV